MWTHFWDMHSGGGAKEYNSKKEEIGHIYIEARQDVAEIVFYNRFGHNPNRVSCTCCGNDYSISEYKTLKEATEYQRNDYESKYRIGEKIPLPAYLKQNNIIVIRKKDIKAEERVCTLPEQGYVWHD